MGSMMSQMGGGGSSGGGGMGMPGMPQQNGTENDMPSQNIMGMQVPDFMGNMYKNTQEELKENPYSQMKTTAAPSSSQSAPATGGDTDNMMAALNNQVNSLNGQINNIGTGQNPGTSVTPMYKNGLPVQNYGLNLGGY